MEASTAAGPNPPKTTPPGVRDRQAGGLVSMPGTWPVDAEGNPMAIVVGTVSDLVPTVQYGNVLVGPLQIMRPVPNGTIEQIIEEASVVQKAVEFVCGQERRIIQWAIDPSAKVAHPTTGQVVTPEGLKEPEAAPAAPAEAAATPTGDSAPPAS